MKILVKIRSNRCHCLLLCELDPIRLSHDKHDHVDLFDMQSNNLKDPYFAIRPAKISKAGCAVDFCQMGSNSFGSIPRILVHFLD